MTTKLSNNILWQHNDEKDKISSEYYICGEDYD